MSENRTILGYISKTIAGKPEIAFPEVRAWIVEPGKVVTRPLAHEFPESGTVYLHAYHAYDSNPLPDHYGIFECESPKGHPDRKNTWKVVATDQSVAQIISTDCPLESALDFYAELEHMQNVHLANTFCGSGRFYFLSPDGWIVGPYTIKNGALAAASERTMRWKKSAAELLKGGEGGLTFISARTLVSGITFPPTLQDAIKRILKLIAKNGRCAFLSRQHIAELSQEMMQASIREELSWFVGGMSELLPRLKDTLEASDGLSRELLGNAAIGTLLEARWRESHAQKVGEEETKLKATTAALQKVESKHEELVKTTTKLGQKAAELQASIASQKDAAQNAFHAEIGRLSADPSEIAILSSLLSRLPTHVQQHVSVLSPWREVALPSAPSTAPSGEAIVRGLLDAGLSMRCAREMATAAVAGFLSGQIVSISHPLAALFSEAILIGYGHCPYWSCEVPAGLLEPISAPTSATGGQGYVFHGANRSDFNLVVAGVRPSLLKQLIGGVPPSIDVVFTLDETEGLVVAQPLPVGPCLSGVFLTFSDSPNKTEVKQFPPRVTDVIPPMASSDFEELFPESFAKLRPFKNSFLLVMARKYCSSLKSTGCEVASIKEIFLKYWLLPRLTRTETAELLKTEEALCKRDAQLAALLTSSLDE